MKPFSETTNCPKCGCADATVSYCRSGYCKYSAAQWNEHIDRICIRCGYGWTESCLNKEE